MPFELTTFQKVRVLDVRVLSSKDRKPGDPVGSQLLLRATMPHTALAMLDAALPSFWYRRPQSKTQGELDGIESGEATNIGEHMTRTPWQLEQTGCRVVIDFGTGGKSNIELGDCTAHRMMLKPKQGGSVDVQWTIDAPALTRDTRGKLTDLKSTDVQMTLTGPEVDDSQQTIDGTDPDKPPKAAAPRKPGAAERAAVANVTGDPGEKVPHKGAKQDAGDAFTAAQIGDLAAAEREARRSPEVKGGTRTARGAERTAAALAAGADAAKH